MNGIELPEVTIGMPVFNDVVFIEESIVSILNQTYKNFNLILSEDDSTDTSADVSLSFALTDVELKSFVKI